MPYPKVVNSFDPQRREFEPYGFTCEQWLPRRMKRPDRHNEIELNLILEGELVYLFGGRLVTLHAGQLAVFWASVPHQIISCDENSPYFVATLPLPWLLTCRLPGAMVQQLLNGDLLLESIADRQVLDRELFRQWIADLAEGAPARQHLALLEMEARLHRLAQSSRPLTLDGIGMTKIEQITHYIAQHYTEPLRIEQIARSVGLHPNYTMELFRKTLGTTLLDYINHHRVTHAQRLLVTTSDSVLEIALQSGFRSLSRFNAVFKAHSGSHPSAFRRNNRLPLLQVTPPMRETR